MQPFHDHHLCATDDHVGGGDMAEYASHRLAWLVAGYASCVGLALLFAWMLLRSG